MADMTDKEMKEQEDYLQTKWNNDEESWKQELEANLELQQSERQMSNIAFGLKDFNLNR